MSWLDTTVMIVPLILVGVVALLLIKTIVQARRRPTPRDAKPQKGQAESPQPARRDPPQMASLTQDNGEQSASEGALFGQAAQLPRLTPSCRASMVSGRPSSLVLLISKGGWEKHMCSRTLRCSGQPAWQTCLID